ncbi:DUF4446 family protein [Vallitalea pronyensis]|uniref:DUF4446 family protein n=1 Tax=Vallitalea pronyensis TaxID=1348613 RepID=A0A8J8MGD2_9FIRM|nr:DUF4446 family protein [Vallitalea pronyensis]QUI21105.1 DUF4446 family protein [Vallitalea pronyensis]
MDIIRDFITDNTVNIILGLCVFSLFMFICVVVNAFKSRKWKKRYYRFMQVKEAFSIEDVLKQNIEDIDDLKDHLHKQQLDMRELEKHVRLSIEKVSLVKYNALEQMGGEVSFVVALINQKNTGLLINGIHSREGCYTYVKEIVRGKCDKALSKEEKEALEKAMKQR